MLLHFCSVKVSVLLLYTSSHPSHPIRASEPFIIECSWSPAASPCCPRRLTVPFSAVHSLYLQALFIFLTYDPSNPPLQHGPKTEHSGPAGVDLRESTASMSPVLRACPQTESRYLLIRGICSKGTAAVPQGRQDEGSRMVNVAPHTKVKKIVNSCSGSDLPIINGCSGSDLPIVNSCSGSDLPIINGL